MTKRSSIFWAIALSIGIFACSDIGPTDGRNPESEGTRELRIFSWGDYFDPESIKAFSEETGIMVRLTEFENAEEMAASLQSQPDQYDIITVDDHTLCQLRELSLLKQLNGSRLTNLQNIDRRVRDQIAEGGDDIYAIPYMSGTTLIAYRKDKITEIEKSWSVLFDPRYAGRMAMLDEFDDNLAIALMSSGLPSNSIKQSDIEIAKKLLIGQLKDLGGRVGSYTEILDKLESGELWVGVNYSGDTAAFAEENPNIGYFLPEEGPILWTDSLVVSRDSQNIDTVYKFLDFMMRGDIAAQNADYLCLATANLAAGPYLDPDMVSDPRIYLTEEVLTKSEPIRYFQDKERATLISKANREFLDAARDANAFLNSVESALAQTQDSEEGGGE